MGKVHEGFGLAKGVLSDFPYGDLVNDDNDPESNFVGQSTLRVSEPFGGSVNEKNVPEPHFVPQLTERAPQSRCLSIPVHLIRDPESIIRPQAPGHAAPDPDRQIFDVLRLSRNADRS